jgi:hypothetical protein
MGGKLTRLTPLVMGLAALVIGGTVLTGPAANADRGPGGGGGGGGGGGDSTIRVKDECDPATFNAALGAGACQANGEEAGETRVTLDQFNAELARTGRVDDWKFDGRGNERGITAGKRLTLVSRAGETHTFTKVARFGGGFVAGLNQASGNPTPAPECATVNADGTLTPVPANANNIRVTSGSQVPAPTITQTANFQCCIHPWMRITIPVR